MRTIPYRVSKLSLDVLKLYHGEDVVWQEPKDVDHDGWVDEGELTQLPEISLRGRERVYTETVLGPRSPEISAEPGLDIQVIPEDPEEMAVQEGIP